MSAILVEVSNNEVRNAYQTTNGGGSSIVPESRIG